MPSHPSRYHNSRLPEGQQCSTDHTVCPVCHNEPPTGQGMNRRLQGPDFHMPAQGLTCTQAPLKTAASILLCGLVCTEQSEGRGEEQACREADQKPTRSRPGAEAGVRACQAQGWTEMRSPAGCRAEGLRWQARVAALGARWGATAASEAGVDRSGQAPPTVRLGRQAFLTL